VLCTVLKFYSFISAPKIDETALISTKTCGSSMIIEAGSHDPVTVSINFLEDWLVKSRAA